MPLTYPWATWRPVARYQPGGSVCRAMPNPGRGILHTAVSGASSLYPLFSQAGQATAHFYVRADGTVEQYVSTQYRSSAQLEGNHDCISIETQDCGGPFPDWDTNGSDVPAWTDEQVAALSRLMRWCHEQHGIPLVQLPSSLPGTRGVGWHRQGIDPWRVTGGESWSPSRGKVCPGDRRVAQVSEVISLAVSGEEPDVQLTDQVGGTGKTVGELLALLPGIAYDADHANGQASASVGLIKDVGRQTTALATSVSGLHNVDVPALASALADAITVPDVTQQIVEDALRHVLGSLDQPASPS